MISCTEATRQLWEYLEGSVAEDERKHIEEHLALCLKCCGAAEFAKELGTFLVSHGTEELPPDVHRRLSGFLEEL
jgi:hypothetical protein